MDRTTEEIAEEYRKYRGRCRELAEAACKEDPTLRLVRGYYHCPYWNVRSPHWWCAQPDGTIHDPTRGQFLSNGYGFYEEFTGTVECSECGKEMKADEAARLEGNYAFCSSACFGKFVGL